MYKDCKDALEGLKSDMKQTYSREHILCHYEVYRQGWNDAIDAVIAFLQKSESKYHKNYLKENKDRLKQYRHDYYMRVIKPKRQAERERKKAEKEAHKDAFNHLRQMRSENDRGRE